jgi:GNAT superfamily N-acetyltransferase
VIRPAVAADVASLVGAYDWLFAAPGSTPGRWDPGRAAARLEDAIESSSSEVFVADEDGVIGGICTVYLDIESVRFGQRACVEDLAVDPALRSRGLGKALLDAAKAWARERGAARLELTSGEARRDAHRFYERERPSWRSLAFGWDL